MKIKSVIFVILGLFLASPSLLAQSANYKQPMTVDAKGQIKDGKGVMMGLVTKDQIINDAKGQKITFVDGQGNLGDAKTGKKMGRMGKDGKTYLDANGGLLFTVRDMPGDTCDILDARGNKIGNVHDSYKGSACALHCFQAGHTHMNYSPIAHHLVGFRVVFHTITPVSAQAGSGAKRPVNV